MSGIAIAENYGGTWCISAETITAITGSKPTRRAVANALRQLFAPRVHIHVGGRHVAACDGSRRLLMVTGSAGDWK